MSISMGLGKLGGTNIIFSHKVRWTLEASFPHGNIESTFVKVNGRPQLKVIPGCEEKTYDTECLDGTFTTTIFGLTDKPDDRKDLWDVLRGFFDVNLPKLADIKGTGSLKLWNGCGCLIEEWKLEGLRPISINFGELDYSSSEEVNIEITWVYSRAVFHDHTQKKRLLTLRAIEEQKNKP